MTPSSMPVKKQLSALVFAGVNVAASVLAGPAPAYRQYITGGVAYDILAMFMLCISCVVFVTSFLVIAGVFTRFADLLIPFLISKMTEILWHAVAMLVGFGLIAVSLSIGIIVSFVSFVWLSMDIASLAVIMSAYHKISDEADEKKAGKLLKN